MYAGLLDRCDRSNGAGQLSLFVWMLVSNVVAIFAGRYVGRRFLLGRISAERTLVLATVLVLAYIFGLIFLLRIPIEYVLWVGAFIGAAASIALEDPYGIHAWLEKDSGSVANKQEEIEQ